MRILSAVHVLDQARNRARENMEASPSPKLNIDLLHVVRLSISKVSSGRMNAVKLAEGSSIEAVVFIARTIHIVQPEMQCNEYVDCSGSQIRLVDRNVGGSTHARRSFLAGLARRQEGGLI